MATRSHTRIHSPHSLHLNNLRRLRSKILDNNHSSSRSRSSSSSSRHLP